MERHVMWIPAQKPGFEHLKLIELPKRVTVSGLLIGIDKDPFRIHYEIGCDAHWRVHRVDIELLDLPIDHSVCLVADGNGQWTTADGEPLPEFDGCIDIDISVTPFSNTIPIRRLNLQVGQSADLKVLLITVPSMKLSLVEHRYTCLERQDAGGAYRFESLSAKTEVLLTIDRDGIVTDYPGGYQCVLLDGGN